MAGSTIALPTPSGSVLGQVANSVLEYGFSFVADASNATIPSHSIPTNSFGGGNILGIFVKFGTTPPDTLTITVTNSHGIPIAIGTTTESGGVDISSPIMYPVPFVGSLTVELSGNATNSATGEVYLNLI